MKFLVALLVALALGACTATSQPGSTRPVLECPEIYNGCFSD